MFDGWRIRFAHDRTELIAVLAEELLAREECERVIALLAEPHRDDPGREDFARQLAESMSKLGRKSEALKVIERTRAWLRDELGVTVNKALADTEMSILSGGVEIERQTPQREPAASTMFVGRQAELERLSATASQSLMLSGSAGIGKTTLLAEVTARLLETGEVLSAVPLQAMERPMAPIADLIEQILDHPETTDEIRGTARPLHRLIPERVDLSPGELGPVGRDELLAAASDFLLGHLKRTGATLILDDCHWLDQGSCEVVAAIINSGDANFIGAMRPEPSAISNLIDEQDTMTLGPLALDHTRELVEQRVHRETSPAMIEALHSRSGGNPLFLTMLLDLDEEGELTDTDLPPSILTAVQRRFTDLSLRARRALEHASVIDGSFRPEFLADLCADPERDLAEAIELDFLLTEPGGELRFAHVLMREAIEQLLPAGRRVAAHDSIGRALELSLIHISEPTRPY